MSDERRDARFDILRPGGGGAPSRREARRRRRRAEAAAMRAAIGPSWDVAPGLRGAGGRARDLSRGLSRRGDLHGLLGLLALGWLLWAAGIEIAPGGFVAVDAFLTLLGWVVMRAGARAVLSGEAAGGSAGLRARASRLAAPLRGLARATAPALLVSLAGAAILAWSALAPEPLARFGLHLAAAPFAEVALDPAELPGPASAAPLGHLWALAVAAQLALGLGALILFVAPRARSGFPALLAFLLAVSLGLAVRETQGGDPAAFQEPWTRGWQLLTGALIAAGAGPRLAPGLGRAAGIAGAALLLAAVFWSPGPYGFPGFPALAPVAGMALILLSEGRGPAAALLRLRALTGLGAIAWPLFLWGWPLIALSRAAWGEAAPMAPALALAVLLALLTRAAVERPSLRLPGRPMAGLGALAAMLLVAAGAGLTLGGGAPERLSRTERAALAAGAPSAREEACLLAPCRFGAEGPVRIALIGDELAAAMLPGIEAAAARLGLGGEAQLMEGCAPAASALSSAACAEHLRASIDHAAASGARVAVLAGGLTRSLARDPGGALGLVGMAEALHARGMRIVVLPPPPSLGFDPAAAELRRLRFGAPMPAAPRRWEYLGETALLLRAAAAMPRGTRYAGLAGLWCPPGGMGRHAPCATAAADGTPLYRDDRRPSAAAAPLIEAAMIDALTAGPR